jgi:hypothetical protein
MKSTLKIACTVLLLLSLAGCIESRVHVRVHSDGSGTVEESFLLSSGMLQMMAAIGGPPENGGDIDLIDRDKLEKKAAHMGGGAKLDTVEKIAENDKQGYRAIYSFADINSLSINQNPDENMPEPSAQDTDKEAPTREYITFQLKKNAKTGTSILTIINPKEEPDESNKVKQNPETGSTSEAEMSPEMTQMFKQMFKDMRIIVDVSVDGKIVQSDASFVDNSTVTLIDMDFNKIIENEDIFKTLTASDPQSLEETKKLIQSIRGIKAELQDRVTVEFK